MLLPTSEEGSCATPSLSKLGPGPSALAYSFNEGLVHDPQAELAPHGALGAYTQSEYIPHAGPAGYLHRRSDYDARHEERISTTAVLAGVLGGFGGLCVVGCMVWVVRRKRFNPRREARREREMVAKPQAERVSNTVEGSERTVRPDGGEGGLLKKLEKAEAGEVSPLAARETGASTRINVAARPRDGRPSSASKPADRPLKMSGSTDSLIRSAARGTTNPLAASSSPLARETPLSPIPQVLSREKNQGPRPRPPQEEPSRPETPTLPVHPPLAFGTSSLPVGAKTSTSSPTPRVRPQSRRDRAGTADGSASSDTEYFSDTSHNAAPRLVQMVTNMGGIGGGQGVGNVPRTDRSPRVQQTVVLDLPPAYSPD